ncbi:hypothetical protein SAMN04488097_0040 [Epilithonimonas lactis]|nr:hypothetical protein SAMN04488097_0040 [Epilithonimonas lactis]
MTNSQYLYHVKKSDKLSLTKKNSAYRQSFRFIIVIELFLDKLQ